MPDAPIVVYAARTSPRLQYVLDWLLVEQLGLSYTLTSDADIARNAERCIAYGYLYGAVTICQGLLLWETDINSHPISRKSWEGLHTLYFDDESRCSIPFDMLSGIFYLLSRYEEHLPFDADKHGRYPHTASILDMDGVLERPIVDEWVEYFRTLLERQWNIEVQRPSFSFMPTYDIDIAYSYLHKGWKRSAGAALKNLVKGDIKELSARAATASGREKDPYDAYDRMQELHKANELSPTYFILAARSATPFDKNIRPEHPAMQVLVKRLGAEGKIGIHPSYYTAGDSIAVGAEKKMLEEITGRRITISRQHYIRLRFPETYETLMACGIEEDYSMGYSTAIGFRAGTSRSFLWYSLAEETAKELRVYPFCFMDTTGHYDMGLATKDAFGRLEEMELRLRKNGGVLTTIFHNFSLGSDKEWVGWSEGYAALVRRATS